MEHHVRDLSFCARHLEAECQKLEAHDERFITIADLAQAGRYAEVAVQVEALLADNLYEVRLVTYALFAAVSEDGPQQLGTVLEHGARFLGTNFGSPAPPPDGTDARLPHVDRAFTWLLRSIADMLEYQQAQRAETWIAWVDQLDTTKLAALIAAARALSTSLPSPMFQSSGAQLVRVLQLLRGLEPTIAAARSTTEAITTAAAAEDGLEGALATGDGWPEPSGETARAATTSTKPPQDAQRSAGGAASAGSRTGRPAAPARGASPRAARDGGLEGSVVQLRATARFAELCGKLQAFESLVKHGEFDKAAIVSSDIMNAIEQFDPRAYFPELFASFGALLSAHIQQIGPRWEDKGSLEWRALEQFYQVDLESFVGREP